MIEKYIEYALVRAEDNTVRLYETKPFMRGIYTGALVEVDTPRGRQVGVVLAHCSEVRDGDTAKLIRAIADPCGDMPLRRVTATLIRDVIEYEDEESDGEEDDTVASDS